MATTGDSRGGGTDPGGGEKGSVGRQMVPRWDKRAGGKGQGQRHVDVSDDLEESSSFQHSGSEEQQKRTGEQSAEQNHQKKSSKGNTRVVEPDAGSFRLTCESHLRQPTSDRSSPGHHTWRRWPQVAC